MNFNISMPKGLRAYYREELMAYRECMQRGAYPEAWRHLERAHILGQAYPREHSHAHWCMLLFGLKIKSWREVFGQIPRLLVGGVKSFVGKIPVGNTGGANVHPLRPMEIPADLQEIFTLAGNKNKE